MKKFNLDERATLTPVFEERAWNIARCDCQRYIPTSTTKIIFAEKSQHLSGKLTTGRQFLNFLYPWSNAPTEHWAFSEKKHIWKIRNLWNEISKNMDPRLSILFLVNKSMTWIITISFENYLILVINKWRFLNKKWRF